jgi:hypothetical protein
MDWVALNPQLNIHFFYEKDNKNHELDTFFFVLKRMISAVKRIEFVSDIHNTKRSLV